MPEIHYVDNFYVMEDVNAEGVVKVNRYESLDEAMQEYLRLPNSSEKSAWYPEYGNDAGKHGFYPM